MRVLRALISVLAPLVLLAATTSEAAAYERQWQAGVGLGYSLLMNGGGTAVEPDASLHGIGLNLGVTYGLNDTFNLLAFVDTSIQPGGTPVGIAGASVGAAYVFDVLRWVPWAGVTVGGYAVNAFDPCVTTNDASCTTFRLGVSGLLGLDYQLNRSFSIGGMGRYGVLLFGNQNAVDQTVAVFARAQYIWGY